MVTSSYPPELSRTPKKVAFLAALEETGNLHEAAKAAGCHISSHYVWLKDDPGYTAAYNYAMEIAIGKLEAEARRRALTGWDEPVFQGGKQVGVIHRYSEILLIFLLKGALPEKYRERLEVSYDLSQLSDEELQQLDAISSKIVPISAARRRSG